MTVLCVPNRTVRMGIISITILFLSACASYITPGGPAQLSSLAEGDVNALLAKKPAATFPTNLAVARVQAPASPVLCPPQFRLTIQVEDEA